MVIMMMIMIMIMIVTIMIMIMIMTNLDTCDTATQCSDSFLALFLVELVISSIQLSFDLTNTLLNSIFIFTPSDDSGCVLMVMIMIIIIILIISMIIMILIIMIITKWLGL